MGDFQILSWSLLHGFSGFFKNQLRKGRGKRGGRPNGSRGRGKGRGRGRQPVQPVQAPNGGEAEAIVTSDDESSKETARIHKAAVEWERPSQKRSKTKSKTQEDIAADFKALMCKGESEVSSTALTDFLQVALTKLTAQHKANIAAVNINYAEFHAGMGTGSIALESVLMWRFISLFVDCLLWQNDGKYQIDVH